MEARDIALLRLSNQRLSAHPLDSAVDVVRWFGAVQSQEYPYAKWGVGQRAPALSDADIEQALTGGAILRAHAMRPTWHFVAADDYVWLQALTGPRVHAFNRTIYERNGLDAATLGRAREVIADALEGGNALTRQEIRQRLADAGIEADGQRLAYIVMHEELDAVICNGPRRGKQHTYALVSERVPNATAMERDAALAELTRRYFSSHGPATVRDFVWWSGLLTKDAREGLAMLGDDVERFTADGVDYFHVPALERRAPADAPLARLLQAYDEYIVAYTQSRGVTNASGLVTALPAGRPLFMHPVTIDGQLVGFWRRVDGRKETTVELKLARDLAVDEHAALQREADRFASFIDTPVTLTSS